MIKYYEYGGKWLRQSKCKNKYRGGHHYEISIGSINNRNKTLLELTDTKRIWTKKQAKEYLNFYIILREEAIKDLEKSVMMNKDGRILHRVDIVRSLGILERHLEDLLSGEENQEDDVSVVKALGIILPIIETIDKWQPARLNIEDGMIKLAMLTKFRELKEDIDNGAEMEVEDE